MNFVHAAASILAESFQMNDEDWWLSPQLQLLRRGLELDQAQAECRSEFNPGTLCVYQSSRKANGWPNLLAFGTVRQVGSVADSFHLRESFHAVNKMRRP